MSKNGDLLIVSILVVASCTCNAASAALPTGGPNVEILPDRCPDVSGLPPSEQRAILTLANCAVGDLGEPVPEGGVVPPPTVFPIGLERSPLVEWAVSFVVSRLAVWLLH